MKRLSILGVLAITLSLFVGCNKNNGSPSVSPVYLLSVIKTTANGKLTDSSVYKYDTQNRIIEFTDVPNNNTDVKYIYDANGHLNEVDTYHNNLIYTKSIYTYSTNSINQQVNSYSNGSVASTSNLVLTINSSQQITKVGVDANDYNTYTYDASGNQATYNQYISNNLTGPYYAYVYTYDNNKNPFLNTKGDFYVSQYGASVNNVIKQTVTSVNSSTPYVFNYTYTYNTDGYPITRTGTTTGIADQHVVVTYTYIIK